MLTAMTQEFQRIRAAQGGQSQAEAPSYNSQLHHGHTMKKQHEKRPKVNINWREVALRRRKTADCQIIGCVVTTGLLILSAGLAMFLAAWFVLGREDPFILIGPVFAGCGIVVLLLSVEVCVRRQKVIKQTEDLSSDDEDDGHYMDEGLINYGFGHFQGETVVPVAVSQGGKSPSHPQGKSPNHLGKSPIVVRSQSQAESGGYQPDFHVAGRLRPEDRPEVNVMAPTPSDTFAMSLTQESIEMLLSPGGGKG